MRAVSSKLRHGQIMRLGAIIVIGVSIVAISAKVLPALPQSDDVRSFDAGYLKAAVFIDDSSRAMRQDAATESDSRAPLFGMETEPVAGGVAAKWRAVKADIDHEQQVMARCRAQEAWQSHRGDCEDYAIVKYVAQLQAACPMKMFGSSSCETSFRRKIMRP
jgi:hypothetical protein